MLLLCEYTTNNTSSEHPSSHLVIYPTLSPLSFPLPLPLPLTVEAINECVRQTGIDLVQLHGDEPPDVIERIHAPCIKVLHVAPKGQGLGQDPGLDKEPLTILDRLQRDTAAYANHAVSLLLDSRMPGNRPYPNPTLTLTLPFNLTLQPNPNPNRTLPYNLNLTLNTLT